jgi:hypothetical protein
MANESWVYQGRQAHGYFGSGTSKDLSNPADRAFVPIGNDGMPRDPQRQNQQVKDVCRILKLNKIQRRLLHEDIHGDDCTFGEILKRAMEMFK